MSDHDLTCLIPPTSADCGGHGWRCPDDAQLAAFVEGRMSGRDREAVMLHLADCAFCRGQVGFLVRVEKLDPPPPAPTHLLAMAQAERSWWVGRLRPAGVAAALLGMALALMLVASRERHTLFPPAGQRPGSAMSAPSGGVGERPLRTGHGANSAPRIVEPVEGQSVSRKEVELRWEEVSGALFYTVQVVDPQGDVVWEGHAEGAHLKVPRTALLAPGRAYFAWVLAHLRSGATVRSSAVGFRVAPD
jgi:hypothetical protein